MNAKKEMKDMDKLEKENTEISEKETIPSGGRSGFLDSLNKAYDDPIAQNKLVNDYYEKIRQGKNKEFIERVSKNSKMSYTEIEQIVNHIFIQRHNFEDGSFERFYPDTKIAQTFERLKRGEHTDIDILLLNHELLEFDVYEKQEV